MRLGPDIIPLVDVATWLAAIAGSSVVTTLLTNWWQRREKLAERRRALVDGWRTDLRHAYAQFIASYSKFLAAGGQLYTHSKWLHDQRSLAFEGAVKHGASSDEADDAYTSAGSPALVEKARQTLDETIAATIDVDTRIVELMLLESRPAIQALLIAIFENQLIALNGNDLDHDLARFQADLASRRRLLDDLTRSLVGMFSPNGWSEAIAVARPDKALPGGGSPSALASGVHDKHAK